MGNEGSGLLAFPLPLALPISSLTLICIGSFGRERKRHRSHECSVTKYFHNENIEPHSKLVFPYLVSNAKLLSSLVTGCVRFH
jgi:hypothetical protein